MTTALQIAKDRTTKNRKAKEHTLKNAKKRTDPGYLWKKKQIRTEPLKVRAGRKTAGRKAHKSRTQREKGALQNHIEQEPSEKWQKEKAPKETT